MLKQDIKDIPGRLDELLHRCDGIVLAADDHGDLVAAWLLQDALQLPYGALHGGARAEVHLADNYENGHFEGHGEAQVLPRRTSWWKKRKIDLAEFSWRILFNCISSLAGASVWLIITQTQETKHHHSCDLR